MKIGTTIYIDGVPHEYRATRGKRVQAWNPQSRKTTWHDAWTCYRGVVTLKPTERYQPVSREVLERLAAANGVSVEFARRALA